MWSEEYSPKDEGFLKLYVGLPPFDQGLPPINVGLPPKPPGLPPNQELPPLDEGLPPIVGLPPVVGLPPNQGTLIDEDIEEDETLTQFYEDDYPVNNIALL